MKGVGIENNEKEESPNLVMECLLGKKRRNESNFNISNLRNWNNRNNNS